MDYATGTTVELAMEAETDQLLVRQEYHSILFLDDHGRLVRGQRRSRSSRYCVKRQSCFWSGAERGRSRVEVGRQTRGRRLQKVLSVRWDTALKKLARGRE